MALISLGEVQQLAHALLRAKADVESVEDDLKAANERVRVLQEESIPSAMQELGLKDFTLESGEKVTVKDDVYASITAEKKADAFAWLEEHNFGGLIKTEVAVQFGKDSAEAVEELLGVLKAMKLEPEASRSVNAQTLKAFLREQLEKGEKDLPLDLFGARPVTVAQIKAPAKTKKK
jgi:hypothetical protein